MAIPNPSSQNDVASGSNTQNSSNSIHDPLYISNSDHPGMVLTNTPFNGSNFLGWSRTIKMALGAKLKLGFITGSTPRPAVTDENHQKWVRCDYMVTCWILNSMTAELTEAFLYAQSAAELWKEINERYGQSNGPLIYHLQRELNNVSQGSLTIAAYFNKLKRCWDELHNLNGVPTCSCGKMQECSCGLVEKFAEIENRSKLVQFLMKLNEEYESVRNQVLAMDPLPNVNKAYYIVQQVEKQKQVTNHMPEPVAFFANVNQFKNDDHEFSTSTPNNVPPNSTEDIPASPDPHIPVDDIPVPTHAPSQPSVQNPIPPDVPLRSSSRTTNDHEFSTSTPNNVPPNSTEDIPASPDPHIPVDDIPVPTHAPSQPSVQNPIPPDVPLRRSSRTTSTPNWLKDFITPQRSANHVSKEPKYPLFSKTAFQHLPQAHIAFIANFMRAARMKWTALHARFLLVVELLGGHENENIALGLPLECNGIAFEILIVHNSVIWLSACYLNFRKMVSATKTLFKGAKTKACGRNKRNNLNGDRREKKIIFSSLKYKHFYLALYQDEWLAIFNSDKEDRQVQKGKKCPFSWNPKPAAAYAPKKRERERNKTILLWHIAASWLGNIPPDPPSSSRTREAEVYTLDTGQWRSLGHVPYWLNDWDEPFLNTKCSLDGSIDKDSPEKLCSFDIDKETFQLFPSPPFDAFDDARIPEEILAILKGCLCQSHTFVTGFTIWVMKEYGIKKSWHKEVVIKRSISRDLDFRPLYLIGGLEDGTILMVYYLDEVLAYCPKTKTCDQIDF
ncbi:hypothetical protein CTI12_AA172360 [Artemisia annua]|uniref:Retrotransposon Copia-like N-terminal domain-containing protein n=1 Tax=Artemisia annua TaxID=35608 RepID=A0A2U1P2J7_ARTAN|nr:hypothetical protein CTI12_AA172360 [Artemisia annua]